MGGKRGRRVGEGGERTGKVEVGRRGGIGKGGGRGKKGCGGAERGKQRGVGGGRVNGKKEEGGEIVDGVRGKLGGEGEDAGVRCGVDMRGGELVRRGEGGLVGRVGGGWGGRTKISEGGGESSCKRTKPGLPSTCTSCP